MLANILAIVVGGSSLYLLSTAFLATDRHRQDDFLWGALGLFYALVLWLCAERITGAILLGQTAASILFLAFGWQTLKLRQALFYPDKPVQLFSVVDWLTERLGKVTAGKPPKAPVGKAQPIATVPEKVAQTVAPILETAREADIFDDFDDFENEPEIDDNVTEAQRKTVPIEGEAVVVSIEASEPVAGDRQVTGEISTEMTATLEETPHIAEDLPPQS